MCDPSVPIIVPIIVLVNASSQSRLRSPHIIASLGSHKDSSSQQPRLQILRCERIFAVPQPFEADDPIHADAVYESNHAR